MTPLGSPFKSIPAVIFRVDSSSQIGSGHLSRCLALASRLNQRGCRSITMICRDLPGNLNSRVTDSGIRLIALPKPPQAANASIDSSAGWLQVSLEQDQSDTIAALQSCDSRAAILVVDHYAISAQWEKSVHPLVQKLVIIDDLANRDHDCDLLVDYTLSSRPLESRYAGRVPVDSVCLLGPQYAILHPSFAAVRAALAPNDRQRGVMRRLLVFFGGSDQDQHTLRILRLLIARRNQLPPSLTDFDFCMGSQSAGLDDVSREISQLPGAKLHVQTQAMAALIQQADFFIGGGGTHTWERLSLGLPSIVLAVAENQIESAQALAHRGWIHFLGQAQQVNDDSILAALTHWALNPTAPAEASAQMMKVVDTQGSDRIIDAIQK